MAKRAARSTQIERQIEALRMRVSSLEKALKPANFGRLKFEVNPKRDDGEGKARSDALREYYEQKKVERYLKHPSWLAVDLACEKEEADFLRSRGLKPEPSRIPEQFHRGLKGYRPKDKS